MAQSIAFTIKFKQPSTGIYFWRVIAARSADDAAKVSENIADMLWRETGRSHHVDKVRPAVLAEIEAHFQTMADQGKIEQSAARQLIDAHARLCV